MSENNSKVAAGQYLTFNLASQTCAVSIETVREINQMIEITPVPKTPSFVEGVINLRGTVIPVIDLRKKFGIAASEFSKRTCIVVIETNHGLVGTIVDAVNDVLTLNDDQIGPPPQLGDELEMSFLMGIGKTADRVVLLIDILSALSKENLNETMEGQALTEAAEQVGLKAA